MNSGDAPVQRFGKNRDGLMSGDLFVVPRSRAAPDWLEGAGGL